MAAPVHYHSGAFPSTELIWSKLIPLIGSANAAVARYDGLLSAIPNAAVLLSPLTTQEAVLSSRKEASVLKVVEESSGRKAVVLCYPELLNIAEGRNVF